MCAGGRTHEPVRYLYPWAGKTAIGGGVHATDRHPVDMASGAALSTATDLTVAGVLPFRLVRRHTSNALHGRHFGPSWTCVLDERLELDGARIRLVCADGRVLDYASPAPGAQVMPAAGPRWPLSFEAGVFRIWDMAGGITREFAATEGADVVPVRAHLHRTGHRLDFEHDDGGRVTGVRHSGGAVVRTRIDPITRLVTAVGVVGRDGTGVQVAQYRYTGNRLTEVLDTAERALRYTYDDAGRLTSWTDRADTALHLRYDAAGRCVAYTGTAGALTNAIVYEQDWSLDAPPDGRVATLIEAVRPLDPAAPGEPGAILDAVQALPLLASIAAEGPPATGIRLGPPGTARGAAGWWDPEFGDIRISVYRSTSQGDVWQILDAAGNVTQIDRDRAQQVVRTVDATGAATVFTRDDWGLVIATTAPDGAVTRIQRGSWGEPVAVQGPGGRHWQYTSDGQGNPIAISGPDGARIGYEYQSRATGSVLCAQIDATGLRTEIDCDDAGLPVRVLTPGRRTWRYERDVFGRVVTVTDPAGRTTHYTWTVEGQLAAQRNSDGTPLTFGYDGAGRQTLAVDAAGRRTSTEYLAFGAPAAHTAPDDSRLTLSYDTQLRLTSVTNPTGLTWSFEYDAAGRLVAETDYNGARTAYRRDAAGRVVAVTNALDEAIEYRYDAAGRLVQERSADGVTTLRYDAHGDLVEAANADAIVRFQRDAAGRVTLEQVNDVAVSSGWDAAGRRIGRAVHTDRLGIGPGVRTRFGYDEAGLPAQVAAAGVAAVEFEYDELARESACVIGAARLQRRFDLRDRIVAQHVQTPTGTSAGCEYTYTPAGHVGATIDIRRGERTAEFDPAGRVLAVSAGREQRAESYSYDAAGVPTAREDNETQVMGTLVTALGTRNRYFYDRAGHLIRAVRQSFSGQPEHFTYTARGQIRTVTVADGTTWRYGYDAFGRRVAKQRTDRAGKPLDSEVCGWDGPDPVLQHHVSATGTSTQLWTYHPGTGHPLTQHTRTAKHPADASQLVLDSAFHAIVSDPGGVPTELIDPGTGAVAGAADATAWGRTRWDGAATALRGGGLLHDPETGLHYHRDRYYDPSTCAYTTPDPHGIAPNPVNANAFRAEPRCAHSLPVRAGLDVPCHQCGYGLVGRNSLVSIWLSITASTSGRVSVASGAGP